MRSIISPRAEPAAYRTEINARLIAPRWKHLVRERLEMLIGGPLEP